MCADPINAPHVRTAAPANASWWLQLQRSQGRLATPYKQYMYTQAWTGINALLCRCSSCCCAPEQLPTLKMLPSPPHTIKHLHTSLNTVQVASTTVNRLA